MERLDQIIDAPAPASTSYRYAGFLIRFGAIIIDALIIGVVIGVFNRIFGWGSGIRYYDYHYWNGWHWHSFYNSGSGAQLIASWLYEALLLSSNYQATFGKMALGIKVVTTEGKKLSFANATGRHFAKWISALILLIGYLMVIWDPKKQALHDKLANTFVIYKNT